MKFDLSKIKWTPEKEQAILDRLSGDVLELARECGVSTALKIVNKFGGTWLRIKQMNDLLLEIRNEQIRQDYDNGMTGDEAARKYGLSDRQIWTILGKPPPDPEVLSLFDSPEA